MSDTSKLKEINTDMLAALKSVREYVDWSAPDWHKLKTEALATIDAAITKATAYVETPPWKQCGVSEGEWKAMEMIIEYGRNRRAEEGIISQKENNNDPR